MYTPSNVAARAYASIGLESGVMSASPAQLITLLYEGAELSLRMAIRHIQDHDIEKKSAAIGKATRIILDGLRAALDMRHNSELAAQLDALYGYMVKRIMDAHAGNTVEPLEEVLGLLQELHGAWRQIAGTNDAPAHSLSHPIAA